MAHVSPLFMLHDIYWFMSTMPTLFKLDRLFDLSEVLIIGNCFMLAK